MTPGDAAIQPGRQRGRDVRLVADRSVVGRDERVDPPWDQLVVIVAGYQGMSYKREITTLGRGGSDYSAAIIGACLGAGEIQDADSRIAPVPVVT